MNSCRRSETISEGSETFSETRGKFSETTIEEGLQFARQGQGTAIFPFVDMLFHEIIVADGFLDGSGRTGLD